MRPTGSAAARLAGMPAKRAGSSVLFARPSHTPPPPAPAGKGDPTPSTGGGGRSPMVFAALAFGVPLLVIILFEVLRS